MQFVITVLVAVVCIVNGQKSCEKLDDCSCQMTDGTGVVNLTSLGSTLGARFQGIMVADENYNYSYNPCFPFSLGDCRNVAGCQSDESKNLYFTLGTPDSANFQFEGENLQVVYSATDPTDITRHLYVTLRCNESAEVPSLEVIGETELKRYEAVLQSKCACPGLCSERPPSTKDCNRLDQCSCEMSDGSGLVDLRSLGNKNLKPRYKLYIAPDNFFYSYNPCYPFNEGACTNAAMCQLSGDEANQYLIGNSSTASFTYENDNNVHVHYSAQGDGTQLRMTDVRLICDRDAEVARFEPTGGIGNLTYAFNFTSKCVCPNAECT